MKICVYAIAKNEEQNVSDFMETAGEADRVVVLDTGSNDETVRKLKIHGAEVHEAKIIPWRFDLARNIALSLVPSDTELCVSIDLDERLTQGWRKAIEQIWKPGIDRLSYDYDWGHGYTFWRNKIHIRHGYRWRRLVHEEVELALERSEVQVHCAGFSVIHRPDPKKSRSSYLPLLEQSCREDPNDDRNSHFLAREYYANRRYDQAIAEFQRHLSLNSGWKEERATSLRFISQCYAAKRVESEALSWALRACAEAPYMREMWVQLSKVYYDLQNHPGLYHAASEAIKLSVRSNNYLAEPEAWGSLPYDLGSIGAWGIGQHDQALSWAEQASELSPDDQRIKNNIELLRKMTS